MVLDLDLPRGVPTLILLHVVFGIPITTLISRTCHQTVPHELVGAARIDGAGMLRTYGSVILPISIPSFVVVLIWQFTSAWDDFLFAVFFSSSQNGPVTLALNNLANGAVLPGLRRLHGRRALRLPTRRWLSTSSSVATSSAA